MTISTNVKSELMNEAEMAASIHVRFTTSMAKGFINMLGGQLVKAADYLQFEFWDGSILSVVETDDSIAIVDETELVASAKEASNA